MSNAESINKLSDAYIDRENKSTNANKSIWNDSKISELKLELEQIKTLNRKLIFQNSYLEKKLEMLDTSESLEHFKVADINLNRDSKPEFEKIQNFSSHNISKGYEEKINWLENELARLKLSYACEIEDLQCMISSQNLSLSKLYSEKLEHGKKFIQIYNKSAEKYK